MNICVITESSIVRLVYCHHQVVYCLFSFRLNGIRKAVIEIIRSHAVYHFEANTLGKSVVDTERQKFRLLTYMVNNFCRLLLSSFVLL
jgi:hypothetical protein